MQRKHKIHHINTNTHNWDDRLIYTLCIRWMHIIVSFMYFFSFQNFFFLFTFVAIVLFFCFSSIRVPFKMCVSMLCCAFFNTALKAPTAKIYLDVIILVYRCIYTYTFKLHLLRKFLEASFCVVPYYVRSIYLLFSYNCTFF